MTRRWSLIALIAALAAALAFVLLGGLGDDKGDTAPVAEKAAKGSAAPSKAPDTSKLRGMAWWPAHENKGAVIKDAVGSRPGTFQGRIGWTAGPNGGALQLDGVTGHVVADSAVVDTTKADFSVAARVRIDSKGFRSAVTIDGDRHSVFYLQYSGTDNRFAFAFPNVRAVGSATGEPELGRWYHLTGTYSRLNGTLSIYVDGVLAGTAQGMSEEKPSGKLVIGRGKFEGKPVDFWSGAIADVHVYDRALKAAEVTALAAREPSR
ncbi:LamG domain-containing protein [Streptomyces sp. NPDC091371]|uniref:LamG domain-containing protein n=1 Tax=Streptomyces sp. NPDC091371 TaxID=3155303 RepID=UPI003431547A